MPSRIKHINNHKGLTPLRWWHGLYFNRYQQGEEKTATQKLTEKMV